MDIASFHANAQPDGSVLLEWRTQEESRNLGFHIYREQGSSLQRITPSLIAGSALLLRGSLPQHAAKLYRWIDPQPAPPLVIGLKTSTSMEPVLCMVQLQSNLRPLCVPHR